ncbi:hypothetical protein niasHT_022426 [Heterodera trifolii]|uniref:DUF659 domain-containing protein n=1 Tax=Heterodera trifolii TaxID=157864 RepID=A0ABD2KLW5_9BILA
MAKQLVTEVLCWKSVGEGSTVGIFGMGRIGRSIAEKLSAFRQLEIIYHNQKANCEYEGRFRYVPFEELIERSDFLILSASVNDQTKGLFDKEKFERMKSDTILLNIGRGCLVKTDDLYEALNGRKLGGTALDVTEPEPLPAEHPLFSLPNCVITPHIGSANGVARKRMMEMGQANVIAALKGEEMPLNNYRRYYCNLLLPIRPMPPKKTKAAWLRDWIARIDGNAIYTTDGRVIFCEACQQQAPSDQFYQLHQHNQTAKHLKNAQRFKEKQNRQKQQFIATTSTNIPDKFTFDLCSAMISANIPFQKIENNNFRNFLEKNFSRNLPTRKTLCNYLERCFDQKMDEIKNELDGSFYWCSVDETTDKAGRFIANLLLGKLDGQKWHAPKLVSVKVLDKVNSGSVARFVNEGIERCGVNRENALLICTDAAAYMRKMSTDLKVFYPNLLSVTCLAHGLHRIAEKIRDQFPNVDRLIAKTKAVFVKAPYRIKTFRDKMPDLPLPPKPVLTRWGTWMCAAAYYWEHFQSIKAVVDMFDPNDSACIADCQECFTDSVWQDLAYIQSNFGRLSQAITKLETQGLTIQESLEIFAGVQNEMDNAIGEKSERIREKFAFIVSNNAGLQTISQFCQILSGKNTQCDVPSNLVPYYKFAPLTSVDVERSFSIYKSTLADNRMSFSPQNLEMYLICNYNQ